MSQKKYVSLSKLGTFLDNLADKFAAISHKHTMSDITGYAVDSALSSTSTNPVQNKVIDAEFEAISGAMGALELAIDGKAASSHGTHVTYSTTAPVMDGAASVGSAAAVARSDHKHPTDTSRASKSEFDTHTSNTTVHITSAERTNWNAAKTHADSAHAPSNAERNVVVGIQKNGTDLTVNSSTRKVNITVPTTAAEVGAAPSSHNHDDKYDVKGAASSALTSAKTYTDNTVAQKSQVQIITWEADD